MCGVVVESNDPLVIHRYHHNAFFMQQAGETVRNLTSAGFEDFLDLAFLNQDGEELRIILLWNLMLKCIQLKEAANCILNTILAFEVAFQLNYN